jgi:hypothetical protein
MPTLPPDPPDAFLQRNDFLDALLGLISLSERMVSLSVELASDAPTGPSPIVPHPDPVLGRLLR